MLRRLAIAAELLDSTRQDSRIALLRSRRTRRRQDGADFDRLIRSQHEQEVIITCAGAGDTTSKHPAIPVTYKQIADAA